MAHSLTHPFIQGYFVKELNISVEGWMKYKSFIILYLLQRLFSIELCDRVIRFGALEKGLGRKFYGVLPSIIMSLTHTGSGKPQKLRPDSKCL